MKAVILCAGKSTRTYPLTLTRPKPLILLGEKTLLEHNLDQLVGICDDVVLVVGYLATMIKRKVGGRYKSMKLHYMEQMEQRGTGHALLQVAPLLQKPFLVLMGDDLYFHDDLLQLSKEPGILVKKVDDPRRFGVVEAVNGKLADLEEKPTKPKNNLANTAAYFLPPVIFSLLAKLPLSARGEIELTSAVLTLSKQQPITVVEAKRWISVGYPWDVYSAALALYPNGFVDPSASIKGKVTSSFIGPNCIIHGDVNFSVLFGECVVGKGSVLNYSVLGEGVMVEHSTIDSKANVTVNNQQIAVNFGAAVGDKTRLSHATLRAGSMIGPNKKISGSIGGMHYD